MNPDDIDILTDVDGTVIMLTWQRLYFAVVGSLHRRALANPNNRLGALGGDMVRVITMTAYATSLNENYARLFQIMGQKLSMYFEDLACPHHNLQFDVFTEELMLYNVFGAGQAALKAELTNGNRELIVTMESPPYFENFLHYANGQDFLAYHAQNGNVITAFRQVQELDLTQGVPVDGRRYFQMLLNFPRDASLLCCLMTDAVPDLNRIVPPHPYSFAVIARNLGRRHEAAGLIIEITTSAGEEVGLSIGDNENFNVSVDYHGATMNMALYPAGKFARNMELGRPVDEIDEIEETGGIGGIEGIESGLATFTLEHSTDEGPQRFSGFSHFRTGFIEKEGVKCEYNQGWYERKGVPTDDLSMDWMEDLVDAVVAIGSRYPTTPTCHHCGAEMGEGGTPGLPCAACTRLGRGPV